MLGAVLGEAVLTPITVTHTKSTEQLSSTTAQTMAASSTMDADAQQRSLAQAQQGCRDVDTTTLNEIITNIGLEDNLIDALRSCEDVHDLELCGTQIAQRACPRSCNTCGGLKTSPSRLRGSGRQLKGHGHNPHGHTPHRHHPNVHSHSVHSHRERELVTQTRNPCPAVPPLLTAWLFLSYYRRPTPPA